MITGMLKNPYRQARISYGSPSAMVIPVKDIQAAPRYNGLQSWKKKMEDFQSNNWINADPVH